MKFLSLRVYLLKIRAPQDSKCWKFLVEALQYTVLSCFTAWFNLLAQFNKLYPSALKNVTPEISRSDHANILFQIHILKVLFYNPISKLH